MIYNPYYYNEDCSPKKGRLNEDGSAKDWGTILKEEKESQLDDYELCAKDKTGRNPHRMPGGKDAFDKGCCCPIYANRAGEGFSDKLFLVSVNCKVHWKKSDENTYVERV